MRFSGRSGPGAGYWVGEIQCPTWGTQWPSQQFLRKWALDRIQRSDLGAQNCTNSQVEEYHLQYTPRGVRGPRPESDNRKTIGSSNTGHQGLQWMVLQRCYKLSVCVTPKFIFWNLVANTMIFGGGAFGR